MGVFVQKKLPNSIKIETKLVREGTIRSNFGETSEAIFLNSGYVYNDAETAENRFNGEEPGYVYSRYLNPNLAMLEKRLVAIEEGAEAACITASGMAAVFAAIMCQVKAGDHIIANKILFGSCFYIIKNILPNYGIEVTFVDGKDKSAWKSSFKENTTIVFIETPANPNLELVDIQFIANLCKENKASLIVDNVFATQLGQNPLAFGADQVVYSTTKHMDGGGKTLGGAILGKEEFIKETLLPFYRHTGPTISPFNAWLIFKSLETFKLRFDRHSENAFAIASKIENHKKIDKVLYPFLRSFPQYELAKQQMHSGGGMIAIYLKGNKEEAFQFLNKLKIIDISNNLGDAKSLITHPATTTHSNLEKEEKLDLNITQSLVRLSVGLENKEDLIEDIFQALS